MGLLTISPHAPVKLDDRVLAHVHVAVARQVCTGKSVVLDLGDETRIWISPASPFSIVYHGSSEPEINDSWLDALAPRGLSDTIRLCAEPTTS